MSSETSATNSPNFSPTMQGAPSIPCVDMNDWAAGGDRKKEFVAQIRSALHTIGFFAVTNTNTDVPAVDAAYETMQEFFSADLEKKDECHRPETGGCRGYVHSEMAQGATRKDHKEHFHIAPIEEEVTEEGDLIPNAFPTWMDMETPMKGLFRTMNKTRDVLRDAMSLAMGEEEDFLASLTVGGSNLLRALHYPSTPCEPGQCWGAAHTDIDMFTILPRATEEGLQVFLPFTQEGQAPSSDKAIVDEYDGVKGEWIPVSVPDNSVIVNGGDELEALTNGYFRSSVHRIMAKPNVERYSMVYFIHPRNEVSVAPRESGLALTQAEPAFPMGVKAGEMLGHRLMELGLIPKQWDTNYANAVAKLNAEGKPHRAMQRTQRIWTQLKAKAEAQ